MRFFEPVAAGCVALVGLALACLLLLPATINVVLGAVVVSTVCLLKRDRWSAIRLHNWSWVRQVYQAFAIYNFAFRLSRACRKLQLPIEAVGLYDGGAAILDEILATGPDTFQKKPTNRAQIESLMECVHGLVQGVKQNGRTPLVLDIGAGKALFTRAVYEALGREVAVVALDERHQHDKDQFYDPPPPPASTIELESGSGPVRPTNRSVICGEAPYTRIVADVRHLAARTLVPLREAKGGGVVAITKHLCGGATDGSLMALCTPPLNDFVGACCLAPCCHQKMLRNQYCNMPFLESLGFCQTHLGKRGGPQDVDFKNFGMLISMSRHPGTELLGFEYKKSNLLKLLGFTWASELGRKARHLLEEGRAQYLRDHGFEAHLVTYCAREIAGDNIAIIARRREVAAEDPFLCKACDDVGKSE
ncbi:unnamed protein product [Polarella glacialis]|uniref:tRNA:m(4)X modification enzyme TRM13 n=1 Tax=Polarella glacialis TaxID=89957 RepID=A0A813DVL5_POLGL|nr:unnamed protein product [Polarella glacialis]